MLSPAHGPAIAAAFDLGDAATLTGPVARGEQGQVWRLDTERGAFAVKDPFIEMSAADALADADYQDAVRAAGVPMPRPVRTPDGRVLVEVAGAPARVYRWVDVLPKQRRLDPAGGRRGCSRPSTASWSPRTRPRTRGTASRWAPPAGTTWSGASPRRGRRSPTTSSRWCPASWRPRPCIEPFRATQWCHLDLWEDNLRPTPDGGLVVLDWENSGPGDPSQELGAALFVFGDEDPDRIAAFHAAYVAAGGPGRVTGPGTSPCWSPSSATSPRSAAPGGSTRRPRRSGSTSRAGCGRASTSRSPWRR